MKSGDEVRILLELHYQGSDFHGWQIQPNVRTVQGEIEAVIERITGSRRSVVGSGRTDSGVHATGQVASLAVPSSWSARRLRRSLNALLPSDVWVSRAREVSWDFHPRFDAVEREYRYLVGTSMVSRSPFHRPYCWALGEPIELDRLCASAAPLPGQHSFRRFAKAGQEHRGETCTVFDATWAPWNDLGYSFSIRANRYLHHMVRYLVGTMVDVARDRRGLDEIVALLEDPDTEVVTSPPAPPEGLYLERVVYPSAASTPSATRPDR